MRTIGAAGATRPSFFLFFCEYLLTHYTMRYIVLYETWERRNAMDAQLKRGLIEICVLVG